MAYTITFNCIDVQDQACVEVCPVDCIHFDEGDDRMLFINPDECIDCGACEPACPVSAIFAEDDVPADLAEYKELNGLWYSDKATVRARVNALKPA
ncbi:MAG: ferredoxin family protein [Dehalococcoidia bacterium]|nr:ferredoxin family protein [Dehalococcoidia bacterium]